MFSTSYVCLKSISGIFQAASTHCHKQTFTCPSTDYGHLSCQSFSCTAVIIGLWIFHIFISLCLWPLPCVTWVLIWSTWLFFCIGCKLAETGTFCYICVRCLAQSSCWSHQNSTPEVFQSIWNWQQNLTLPLCIQLALSICFNMCLSAV